MFVRTTVCRGYVKRVLFVSFFLKQTLALGSSSNGLCQNRCQYLVPIAGISRLKISITLCAINGKIRLVRNLVTHMFPFNSSHCKLRARNPSDKDGDIEKTIKNYHFLCTRISRESRVASRQAREHFKRRDSTHSIIFHSLTETRSPRTCNGLKFFQFLMEFLWVGCLRNEWKTTMANN